MSIAVQLTAIGFGLCVLLRLLQRLYYFLSGHSQLWIFHPRDALNRFLHENNIQITYHKLKSSVDGTILTYRRVGSGSKSILLCNGVGTDFFMWLPVLTYILKADPAFFQKYTLIVQSYRGLFVHASNDDTTGCSSSEIRCKKDKKDTPVERIVNVTIRKCVDDVQDIMKHTGTRKYEAIVGWSTGAQVAIVCCALYPHTCDNLFLLNVSLERTLHSVFQPVVALPECMQHQFSVLLHNLIVGVTPVIESYIWNVLKIVAHTTTFRFLFEALSFLNGFPPEQAAYFCQYAKDIFTSRAHTHNLVRLIQCLDEPLPFSDVAAALKQLQRCTMMAGYFDFITGVYHSRALYYALCRRNKTVTAAGTANGAAVNGKAVQSNLPLGTVCEQIVFTMGSHFLLLEWPDVVATSLVSFMDAIKCSTAIESDSQAPPSTLVHPNTRQRGSMKDPVRVDEVDLPLKHAAKRVDTRTKSKR